MTRGVKTRCSGKWTEAKFKSFVRGNLRSASRKWAPIYEVMKEAWISRGVYECAECKEHVPPTIFCDDKRRRVKNIFVDHIKPIVDPATGFTTWDDYIEGLFCEKDNLQLLCKTCHDEKTLLETQVAKERKQLEKEKLNEED